MNVYNRFLNFEKNEKLFENKLFGYNYWQYYRIDLYFQISRLIEGISPTLSVGKPSLKTYLLDFKCLKNYFLGSKKNSEILVVTQNRREYNGAYYENKCTDVIANYLLKNHKVTIIEEASWSSNVFLSVSHNYPTSYQKYLYYNDLSEHYLKLYKKLFKLFNKKDMKIINGEYEKLKKVILSNFNELNDIDFYEMFLDRIIRLKTMYNKTKKIILKINPKILLVQYIPTPYRMLIVQICNELKIPTIEIQHGSITQEEPLSKKMKVDKTLCQVLPKYLFSFGKKHINLKNLYYHKNNIIYTGFPYLKLKIEEELVKPKIIKNNKKYILVISQSTIGDAMSKFASKLADELKDKTEYVILYKYHPNELAKDYKVLKKSNIIELKKTSDNIYLYQKNCYCQIGVYSTAIYEGLMFNLPTFLLKNMFHSEDSINLLGYMKKGLYIVENAKEIKKQLEKGLEKADKKDLEMLWENKSLKEIENEIVKLERRK